MDSVIAGPTAVSMEVVDSSSSAEEVPSQRSASARPPPPREKTKRPQLSCNPCRARKVKCDRIQPCTACSLHQIAEVCHFDLSETERQPILQAEALKEKDKEIASLRRQIQLLGGQPTKSGPVDALDRSKSIAGPKVPKKPVKLRQIRFHTGEVEDSLYFGAPGMSSVIEEFARLSVRPTTASITHTVPRGTDIFAFQMATSHPFPTLWSASEGTSGLVKILPSRDEIHAYIDAFQRRAQSCTFPHVPDECTKKEIDRFLDNVEHNASLHPDMLALLFTTVAQGLQNGVYDRYGGDWVAGAVEEESKKGDVYLAAAMQALRLATFMNRPTLLAVETLIMTGHYLTNAGKFLDAWALFGITVRLAQSIGLHRDPSQLNPPAPLEEVSARKNVWWWMLHMDQQYSMTLGRPLGISSIGDCPAPEPLVTDPVIQSLSNYVGQFTILSRQILAAGYLNNDQIDSFSDQLLALKDTLPESITFRETWLDPLKPLPAWPLDAQGAVFHGKTHNYLILLNQQRVDNNRRDSNDSAVDLLTRTRSNESDKVLRGRERVLSSCRAMLKMFEYTHTRNRPLMLCWSVGQQAFNATMILILSTLETGETKDLDAVQKSYSAFLEMKKKGIHRLAGAAVDKLGELLKEVRPGESSTEKVMSKQGMMLLEDPGLQGFLPGAFSPLTFEMAGKEIPSANAYSSDVGTAWAALGSGYRSGEQHMTSQHPRKRGQRKAAYSAVAKPKVPAKKPSLKLRRPSFFQRNSNDLTGAYSTEQSSAEDSAPASSTLQMMDSSLWPTSDDSPMGYNKIEPLHPAQFEQSNPPAYESDVDLHSLQNAYTSSAFMHDRDKHTGEPASADASMQMQQSGALQSLGEYSYNPEVYAATTQAPVSLFYDHTQPATFQPAYSGY